MATITMDYHRVRSVKTDHKNKLVELEKQLKTKFNELDELKNRSLRCNVVIKGIPEDKRGNELDTKSKLCGYLVVCVKGSAALLQVQQCSSFQEVVYFLQPSVDGANIIYLPPSVLHNYPFLVGLLSPWDAIWPKYLHLFEIHM